MSNSTLKEPCFGEFLANSWQILPTFKKDSSFFGKKVSKNGNEWHLGIGIDES